MTGTGQLRPFRSLTLKPPDENPAGVRTTPANEIRWDKPVPGIEPGKTAGAKDKTNAD